jgi:quaternary ammonium compound-resistance protein SugE
MRAVPGLHDDALYPKGLVMTWILLFSAAAFEVVWALALKASDGFSNPLPTAIFVVGIIASMVLLALAMRQLAVGTAYAVWTGTGAVGAALAGIAFFGDAAGAQRLGAIALVATGVVWLALSE